MITSLKEFFQSRVLVKEPTSDDQQNKSVEYAAAILMLEISRADSNIDDQERKVIEDALTTHFHLSAEEAGQIRNLAEAEVDHLLSLQEFTRLLTDNLSMQDRVKIVELLWRVAFADAVVDKYEEYFVRKIADLLYISHKDYIRAKHLASEN